MLKKYVATSTVSLNVKLPSGGSKHINFVPVTGGGSCYYTSDSATQWALERHPYFGTLYRIGMVEKPKAAPAPAVKANKTNKMVFRNNEDAKDYLADKFAISRSKLRSRAAIEECAKKNNVVIEWR